MALDAQIPERDNPCVATDEDLFDLARFVDAQEGVYGDALSELRRGTKVGHWMWFVFPQLAVLGTSETSRRFGIASLREAQQYLRNPVLGLRLRECTSVVNSLKGKSAYQIFGTPDDLKFRSSMTLFDRADPGTRCFRDALVKYFQGHEDIRTLGLLNEEKRR